MQGRVMAFMCIDAVSMAMKDTDGQKEAVVVWAQVAKLK